MSARKIGEGSVSAMIRQGHKEIGQIIPAFKDSVQVLEVAGGFSNPTSYEVSKQTGSVQRSGPGLDTAKEVETEASSVYGTKTQSAVAVDIDPEPAPQPEPDYAPVPDYTPEPDYEP